MWRARETLAWTRWHRCATVDGARAARDSTVRVSGPGGRSCGRVCGPPAASVRSLVYLTETACNLSLVLSPTRAQGSVSPPAAPHATQTASVGHALTAAPAGRPRNSYIRNPFACRVCRNAESGKGNGIYTLHVVVLQ